MKNEEEKAAQAVLNEIEKSLTNGKGLRRYTRLDLVQFTWFWEKERAKGVPIHKAISQYIPLMERTSATEKLENIRRWVSTIGDKEE